MEPPIRSECLKALSITKDYTKLLSGFETQIKTFSTDRNLFKVSMKICY